MTIKELRQFYHISEIKHDGKFMVFDLNEKSGKITPHKYLCMIQKHGTKFSVAGETPVSTLEALSEQINKYVASLPYNSEYYMPMYADYYFVFRIINDYLRELGFEDADIYQFDGDSIDAYILRRKTIFGENAKSIPISITGLREGFKNKKTIPPPTHVSVNYHKGDYSWVTTTVERNVEAIKMAIDSILKPLFISEGVTNINMSDKLIHVGEIELTLEKLTTQLDVCGVVYKTELKKKLLELADTL